jgi:hypothetical protein
MLVRSPPQKRQPPVTESSITLPPDKGVHHVSNPIDYASMPDVPQGNEAYAREGNGRA